MIDDVRDIVAHYDEDPRREADRLRHNQLERDLTWRYLDHYLPTEGAVLELGAATGAYSAPLAKRGLYVTAVDFSSELIEEAKRRIAAEGSQGLVEFFVADARDLSEVPGGEFDAVLMMGPL